MVDGRCCWPATGIYRKPLAPELLSLSPVRVMVKHHGNGPLYKTWEWVGDTLTPELPAAQTEIQMRKWSIIEDFVHLRLAHLVSVFLGILLT